MSEGSSDIKFMEKALEYAFLAQEMGEVPVGCVVVKDDEIVGFGHNRREIDKKATAHAEMDAINMACDNLGGWRLFGCTLYVTLEPCPMCAGAIINARIDKVVFGAYDKKAGSCGSLINIFEFPYNHKPEIVGGILKSECSEMLSKFFQSIRKSK